MGEPSLEFDLALHCGDVMYGNIGVAERLQFTVIGAAANEAARLAGLCKTLSQPVLMSSDFPRCFVDALRGRPGGGPPSKPLRTTWRQARSPDRIREMVRSFESSRIR